MSNSKFHPNQAEVIDDPFYAAYVNYLGHDVMKCSTGPSGTVWTFLVKECDFDIMRQEFDDPETSLFVKPYASAMKRVFSFQKLARQYSGEYVTQGWRDAIRRG
jgi:hypothetical protein